MLLLSDLNYELPNQGSTLIHTPKLKLIQLTIEIKQQNFLRFYWFSTGCLVTKNKIKTNFNKNMAIVVEKRLHFTKFSINLITTQLNKHTRLHVHRKTGLCSTRNLLIIRLFRAYILIRKYQRVKHFFTAWNSSCDLSI